MIHNDVTNRDPWQMVRQGKYALLISHAERRSGASYHMISQLLPADDSPLDDCRQTHPVSQPQKREGKKALRSPTVTVPLSLASRFSNWPGPSHTPSKWQESQDCHQKGCEKTSRAAELAGIATTRRPPSCYGCSSLTTSTAGAGIHTAFP